MPNQPSASRMQRFDEAGAELGPPMPIDLAVLTRTVDEKGEATFQFMDGEYKILGHLGEFVFGLQRVRRLPGLGAPEPEKPPAMDMSKLSVVEPA